MWELYIAVDCWIALNRVVTSKDTVLLICLNQRSGVKRIPQHSGYKILLSLYYETQFAPCKGIQEYFVCGIRNPTEDWNPESILLKSHSRLDWATRSKEKRSMESLACSKRSDSGGRCRVKKAMKSRGGLGRAWNRLWKASPGYMPQRDDIQCNIGISGVKTIVHELHMKGQGHGQRGNPCLWAAGRITKFGGFRGNTAQPF